MSRGLAQSMSQQLNSATLTSSSTTRTRATLVLRFSAASERHERRLTRGKDADTRHLSHLLPFGCERRGENSCQASDEGATVHRLCLRLAGIVAPDDPRSKVGKAAVAPTADVRCAARAMAEKRRVTLA